MERVVEVYEVTSRFPREEIDGFISPMARVAPLYRFDYGGGFWTLIQP